MTDAAPLPIVPPLPTAPPPSAPKPGWQTSEAWLTFLAITLPNVVASGLVTPTSEAAKIIAFAVSVLAAIGYGAGRTALKVAHLRSAAPANDNATPTRSAQVGSARVGVLFVLSTIIVALLLSLATCAGAQKWTRDFAGCEKADFGKLVTIGGATEDVLRAVEDVVLKDPADLEAELSALAVQATVTTIQCAITATEDLLAAQIGLGSAAGSAAAPRARPPIAYPGLGRALAWSAAQRR